MRGGQLASFTGGEIGAAAVTPDPLLLLRHQGSLGDEDRVLGCPVETDPLPFSFIYFSAFSAGPTSDVSGTEAWFTLPGSKL